METPARETERRLAARDEETPAGSAEGGEAAQVANVERLVGAELRRVVEETRPRVERRGTVQGNVEVFEKPQEAGFRRSVQRGQLVPPGRMHLPKGQRTGRHHGRTARDMGNEPVGRAGRERAVEAAGSMVLPAGREAEPGGRSQRVRRAGEVVVPPGQEGHGDVAPVDQPVRAVLSPRVNTEVRLLGQRRGREEVAVRREAEGPRGVRRRRVADQDVAQQEEPIRGQVEHTQSVIVM